MAKAKTPGGRRTVGNQTAAAASGAATVAVDAPAPKKKTTPAQFFSQVRAEARKIVWPSRKETTQTTGLVFVFAVVMALFLWLTDKSLEWVLYDLVLGWK